MPKPNKGESKSDYIARFMSSEEAKKSFPDEKQRYVVALSWWKKYGSGKEKLLEKNKDWRVLEFYVPILETRTIGNDFIVKGVAINETTTRNGIKYIAKELENAAPSFNGKKLLLDHKNEVKSIVGVITNSFYNPTKHSIDFEGKVMDKDIQNMINDGRITDVSIGASVKDLSENKEEGSRTAIGLEGHEISFVAVPGDPNANLAMALDNCFMIKEAYDDEGIEDDEEQTDDEAAQRFGYEPPEAGDAPQAVKDILARAYASARKQYDDKTKCSKIAWGAVHNAGWNKGSDGKWHKESYDEVNIKEVIKMEDNKLGETQMAEMNAMKEANEKLKAELKEIKDAKEKVELIEKIRAEEKAKIIAEIEASKVITPLKTEDKTKGEVSSKAEEKVSSDGIVIEKADTGKGFQIWKDFSKENSGKFKRLIR